MTNLPPGAGALRQIAPLADALVAAAEAAVRKLKRPRRPSRRYTTLHAGTETPLWNELATAVVRQLRRRGEKVRLARLLGISRQRLHVLLVARSACPDAERTLQLLAWLRARQAGRNPA